MSKDIDEPADIGTNVDDDPLATLPRVDGQAVRTAIEAKKFERIKFVDVTLPSDNGKRTITDEFEKIESVFRMDTEGARFTAQMVDKRIQTPKIAAELDRAAHLMPKDVLPDTTDINSLGFVDAMVWEKRYRRAAENGEYYNVTSNPADNDECWHRAMSCSVRAFSLEPKDLLLVHMLDDYHSRGLTAKFPDEAARLLEDGMLMNEDKSGNVQLKFFEKYYQFQLARGRLDEVVDFLMENMMVLMGLGIIQSKVLQDLLKKHPRGEQIRHNLSKNYFGALKTHLPLIDLPSRYNAPKRPGMNTHMVSYELALKGGNYREVEGVLKDK